MQNDMRSVLRIILVPSIITLAVTVLRLLGELQHWSRILFNPAPGGGGAIFGISWLAILFAIYFAIRLQNEGGGLERGGKSVALALLALVVSIGSTVLMVMAIRNHGLIRWTVTAFAVLLGLYIMRMAWPAYWSVMIAYALAARIPVIIVMYFAIKGNWGTHYDSPGPGMTFTDWWPEFIYTGLLPQLFLWVPFTVVICGLFGIITAAIRKRRLTFARA